MMKSTYLLLAGCFFALAGPALADGDMAKGGEIFLRRCSICHSLERGANGIGPSLMGVIDQPAASLKSYDHYSDAMKAFGTSGRTWDEATLAAFLKHPRDVVSETNMGFAGMKNPQDITDVIAYLRAYSRQ